MTPAKAANENEGHDFYFLTAWSSLIFKISQ